MATDPKYVRLAEHMSTSALADVAGGSGWSISGMQVKPFPKDDDDAARFVKSRLVAGLLESAGKAEFDEMNRNDKAIAKVVEEMQEDEDTAGGLQEAQVQEASRAAAEKLASKRKAASGGDDEEDDK